MPEYQIRTLRIDHRIEPIGIDPVSPLFSFVTDFEGDHAVTVRDEKGNPVQEMTVTDRESHAFSFPLPFEPGIRYSVTVSSPGKGTAVSYFETSPLFFAPMITEGELGEALPCFSRTFTVEKSVTSARLDITSLGLYRAFLNGRRIGNDYLTPGCNDYDAYLRVHTYDIGDLLLAPGENVLQVYLGDGWYRGRYGIDKPIESGGRVYGERLGLACAIRLDGEVFLQSDLHFTVSDSPIIESSIYDGEIRDETRTSFARPVSYLPGDYPYTPDFGSPVTELETRIPTLLRTPKGDFILDFGQNFAGIVRCRFSCPFGTHVSLTHGELLQNGEFYRENLRTAKSEFVYLSDGLPKTVEPFFTYFGFRYVRVEGLTEVDPTAFLGVVLSSVAEPLSSFYSSSPRLNRLIENVKWSQKSNFIDIPTDCPQRDERLGWTADARIFARTALFQYRSIPLYRKFLKDLRYEQLRYYGGDLPMYAPSLRGEAGPGGAGWSDIAVLLPDILYRYTGDSQGLYRDYPLMRDYGLFLLDREREGAHPGLFETGFTFGDWLAEDGISPQSLSGGTDQTFLRTVSAYRVFSCLHRAADTLYPVLQKDYFRSDALLFAEAEARIKAALLSMYFTPGGRLAADTQTAYLYALRYGICRKKEVLLSGFRERLKKDLYRLKTGFLGTPLLLPVLFDHGMSEDAFRLLFSEDNGWMYAVRMGATTVWERWKALLPDGKLAGTSMHSLNHYACGAAIEALYTRVAGLRMRAPAFRLSRIAPIPHIRLPEIDFTFDSPVGTFHIGYRIEKNGDLFFSFSVPKGTQCEILLPPGELLSGSDRALLLSGREAVYRLHPKTDYRHPFSLDSLNLDILENREASETLRHYFPAAHQALRREDDFKVENGHFLGTLRCLETDPDTLKEYGAALQKITL